MSILAFDTTLDVCSAALQDQDGAIYYRHEAMPRGQAERLPVMIEEILADAMISFQDVSAIAVTCGPGTFSGTRIGLSAARGFHIVSKMPVYGFNSLQVIAAEAVRRKRLQNLNPSDEVWVVNDARRGEFYVQSFSLASGSVTPKREAKCWPQELIEKLIGTDKVCLVGSGAELAAERLAQATVLTDVRSPDARALLLLMAAVDITEVDQNERLPEPIYLRAPDAKLPSGNTTI